MVKDPLGLLKYLHIGGLVSNLHSASILGPLWLTVKESMFFLIAGSVNIRLDD